MTLHPEVQLLLEAFETAGVQPFESMTVPQGREAAAGLVELQAQPISMPSEDRTIPGPGGDIPIRIYYPPTERPSPVIVYFHGGGWVIGDIAAVDEPVRRIAQKTSSIVVSVDYRLAPEHVFPAAFEDAYAATKWVSENADQIGGRQDQLVVAGDSAGGALAASVALAARDKGGPAIAAQILLYPVTDFNFTTKSYQDYAYGYNLTKASMQWFWAHYLGAQNLEADSSACPAHAESLEGLPPAFVGTAEFDPLRDEGETYADRMRDSGVPVISKRYPLCQPCLRHRDRPE